jgi:hypothetical protein
MKMNKEEIFINKKVSLFAAGICILSLSTTSLLGCNKSQGSFSTLSTGQAFTQTKSNVTNQVDILWVVDNSFSMDPLQQNLVQNFNSFINKFQTKGFDYKMAVTTSDSFLAGTAFRNQPDLAKFRSGGVGGDTGYTYITPTLPDPVATFVSIATQGQFGSGDERAFSSIIASLTSSLNVDFRRPGAFFAIIVLSDEDDFSDATRAEGSWWQQGGIADHSYTNPSLESVDSYVSQLDTLTTSTPSKRNYNVSAITVLDQACRDQHGQQAPSAIIGTRYMDMVRKTGGVMGSICDSSYANSLDMIQKQIIELSTQFTLTREPNPSTITISVDNVTVPQDSTNGWTYDAATNSITFHGTAVPNSGAAINIQFDPAHLL